jgi:hypothetical protein
VLVVPVKQHSDYNKTCNTFYFQVTYTVYSLGSIYLSLSTATPMKVWLHTVFIYLRLKRLFLLCSSSNLISKRSQSAKPQPLIRPHILCKYFLMCNIPHHKILEFSLGILSLFANNVDCSNNLLLCLTNNNNGHKYGAPSGTK